MKETSGLCILLLYIGIPMVYLASMVESDL